MSTPERWIVPLRALLCGAVVLTLVLTGCDREGEDVRTVDRLRIGVLPGEAPEVVRARYQHVATYLEATLDIPCDLVVPESYESLLATYRRGEIDLAYFGGYTFVAARELAGAVPLVARPTDRQFISYFIVPAASTAESIEDLEGARIAFGSRLSTSGHLMPRYFLEQRGIAPEQFFREIRFTGAHDATARAVRDGDADFGCVDARIVEAMLRDGRLVDGDLRILEESPPYVDYVWAARRDVPEELRAAILDAFLALDPERTDHRAVLRAVDARAFLPVAPTEFEAVASVVDDLNMLEDLR